MQPTIPPINGHNPFGLTAEQVGVAEGWRLMDRDEYKPRVSPHAIFTHVQFMTNDEHRHWEQAEGGPYGRLAFVVQNAYRTTLTHQEVAQMDQDYEDRIRPVATTDAPGAPNPPVR